MAIADILAKCGMSADDVARASKKFMRDVRDTRTVAQRNEDKYADIDCRSARLEERAGGGTGVSVYTAISEGADNGSCTTRAGTYRKLRFGDGRRG